MSTPSIKWLLAGLAFLIAAAHPTPIHTAADAPPTPASVELG